MVIVYVFLTLLLLLIAYIIFEYNQAIKIRNIMREAFSTMDVYLKKRWDLVPNLVEIVKGYATHEKDTLEQVIKCRQGTYSNFNNNEKININTNLGIGIPKLFAVAEQYPELKANKNFLDLQKDLTKIEEDIAKSRKYYNGTVRILNNFVESFPTNIIASILKMETEKMFEINDGERTNVEIKL